jgi:uncharacterized damage-inducible protein DinB
MSTAASGQTIAQTYLICDRMDQLIIENLDPLARRAKPPRRGVRTIAAVFSHLHNVRRKWLRLSAPHLDLPAPLDRLRATPEQARAALAESALRCAEMLLDALVHTNGRVKHFRRDAFAKPWPANLEMLAYMITHEAHHRGQAYMLAHQLGFPLPERICRRCGRKRSFASTF